MTTPTDATALVAKLADEWPCDCGCVNDETERAYRSALRALLSLVAQGEADRERLEAGARGALATAAMMLAKLGGSARFTALEQVAIQGRVTRTDEPDGAFTLSFEDAARATSTEGPTHG